MITVVVTASPIPSHPSPHIIDETLASVRHHLPDVSVMVLFDGVRVEQKDMREAYENHIALVRSGDLDTRVFDKHMHQVGMLRRVIDDIETPLLMFVEQDTPLLTNRFIDWPLITEWLTEGRSNCIRLAHEESVPKEHRHMIFGMEREGPFLRTSQYSARPHVATVEKYRAWLTHFTPEANTFLEDKLHSVVQEAVKADGWWSERVHIYHPVDPVGIKRSTHLDGRAGGPKFDDCLVF